MPRRPHEQATIDRFVAQLAEQTGVTWEPSADEISTLKNNRKPDCEFIAPNQTPIVADICSLYPLGSHQDDGAKRAKSIARLQPELRKEGLGGLLIQQPPVAKKTARHDWAEKTACQIKEAAEGLEVGERAEVEGFDIERIADNSEPSSFVHSSFSAYQPIDAAGYPLAALLEKKHDQLDVDGHLRFLIVVNDGCRAKATDVTAGCAFIDFRKYPNFDRIYFEESPGRFCLVYSRDAWFGLEAAKLPENPEDRRLVVQWLEVRLSGNWGGAMETILQICWDCHSSEWLTEGGKVLLEMEAHLFLQNCEWDTPRLLWELFYGPVPRIFDARRRPHAIPAPAKAG